MGKQYLGKPNQFTGDFGAYAIKKQRVTMESVKKLVRKYYKTEEKRRRMLEIEMGLNPKSLIKNIQTKAGCGKPL